MDILTEIVEKPNLAPKHTRVFAALIDFAILLILAFSIGSLFGQSYVGNGSIGFELSGLPAVLFFISGFLLMPVCEGVFGQTIGKKLMRIKVVKMDLTPANIGVSIARHLFDPVDCFFLVGLIVASTNKTKQRIGDLVAKTYVIDKI